MEIENFKNLVENVAANLHDKNEYVIHIRNLKETLNHRSKQLNLFKMFRINHILI